MLLICFHLLNHYLFVIETFPWVMISTCSLFHSDWIDKITCYNRINTDTADIVHVSVPNMLTKVVDRVCLMLAVLLLFSHFLVPFSCGINTLNDEGCINFHSSCQFFRWKMMTRSVRTISSTITLTNPSTRQSDMIHLLDWYNQIKLPHASDIGIEIINVANHYEDKLWYYIQKIKHSAISTDDKHQISPYIYADVWLEINGPPAQRYIDPTVNIAESKLKDYCFFDLFAMQNILKKPDALFDWVLPRITTYRGYDWSNYFDKLSKMAMSDQLIKNSTFKVQHLDQIYFLAEAKPLWTTISLPSLANLVVIRGSIEVKFNPSQVQLISEGSCVTAGVSITWRPTVLSNGGVDDNVLLMLLTNNEDKTIPVFYNPKSVYKTDVSYCNTYQLPYSHPMRVTHVDLINDL